MTPEKKQEWKEHIKAYRKYVNQATKWLKVVESSLYNDGQNGQPPTPPPLPGQDNPPGKPPNP